MCKASSFLLLYISLLFYLQPLFPVFITRILQNPAVFLSFKVNCCGGNPELVVLFSAFLPQHLYKYVPTYAECFMFRCKKRNQLGKHLRCTHYVFGHAHTCARKSEKGDTLVLTCLDKKCYFLFFWNVYTARHLIL